jgi:AraC family L-rhamnose operon regulatory protein RhaS
VARRYGSFPEYLLSFFHGHDNPFPEFPALRHVHEGKMMAGYKLEPHAHPAFEICYIYSGKGTWFAEGQTYQLKPGDIYITKPGEVHGGHTDINDPLHIYDLALDVSALPLPGASATKQLTLEGASREIAGAVAEAGTLHDEFKALEERVIPGGTGLQQNFTRLLSELDAPVQSGTKARMLKLMMVQALLVELLVFVARCSSAHAEKRLPEGAAQTPARPKFQELLKLIHSRASDPPSLSDMAEFVGLSPAHFVVAFKRETGLTPLELVTRIRIDAAAERLTGEPRVAITDVALDLGFSSAQYFSIVFRKQKGCTPTDWRKKQLGREN